MVTAERKRQVRFHNVDLYNSIKIPVREFLIELTGDLELAVLLNQIIFSKKEKMTLNDIIKLSLNEKTKQTIRAKLERLIELGLIRKFKNNAIIFNQDLYEPTDKIITGNNDILAIIEGSDLKYEFNYLMAMILNKFRTYALAGISEVHMSVRQLKNKLGINNSESSIRDVLKQLEKDNYISCELVDNICLYKINVSKITNNYSLSDINKFCDELKAIYKEYMDRHITENSIKKRHLQSFETIIKRMLHDGKDFYILKHILIYLIYNSAEFKSPNHIQKGYNTLAKISFELSKRKAKRFIYKLNNNLLAEERIKAKIPLYWEEANKYCEEYKSNLRDLYYKSLAGVKDVDFSDFQQEALKITFELLKKYDCNIDVKLLYKQLIYRLKDIMYQKRPLDKDNNIINIITESYRFQPMESKGVEFYNNYENIVDYSVFKSYQQDEQEQVEIDFTKNQGIKTIFKVLNDRQRFIIKSYLGHDGRRYTFLEIGQMLGLTESKIARDYKKAILILKEHFPPDMEQDIRNQIYND